MFLRKELLKSAIHILLNDKWPLFTYRYRIFNSFNLLLLWDNDDAAIIQIKTQNLTTTNAKQPISTNCSSEKINST